MDIRVEENPAATVAEMLVEAAERGSHIVLTGGSTPKLAYETAAAKNANWNVLELAEAYSGTPVNVT